MDNPTQNLCDPNLNHRSFSISHDSQGDYNYNISSNINVIEERSISYDNASRLTFQHDDSSANINMQPMPSSQNEAPLVTSTTSSQENMVEYSFFYRPYNDFQIYHIICKEMSFEELISQLLNNNYFHTNEVFMFYFQHPIDKRIYQLTCEMASHSVIVQFLNQNIYGIEINQNEQYHQQHFEFSNSHKENLEFHLKQFLFGFLHR